MRSLWKTGMSVGTSFVLASTLVAGAGCKKKNQDGAGSASATGTGSAVATGSGSATGSGAATGSGSAAAPMTPEQLATWYGGCWSHFNARKWDDFKACFAADMVEEDLGSGLTTKGADASVENAKAFAAGFSDGKGEPQLTLVNGTHIVSITLFTGTHDGALKSPAGEIPASKKPVAILMAHAIDINAEGKAVRERFLMDSGSLMGQMGMLPKEVPFRGPAEPWPEKAVVIAKGDATESANVAAYNAGIETFNKHDLKGVEASFAENAVWSEMGSPKDQSRAEMVKGLEEFWGGFSDMKLSPEETWAAGDYIVSFGTVSGTNDGKFAAMGLDKTGKKFAAKYIEIDHLTGGKVDKAWLFSDSTSIAGQLGLLPPPGGAPPPAK